MRSGKLRYRLFIIGGILLFSGACRKWLPKDLDYISKNATYTQTVFQPILGRTTLYSEIFNTDNSSIPMHFKIVNVRYASTGKPSSDLEKEVPVLVWKQAYTGNEKSVAEIEAKRTMENHPLWEIRPESGDLILWASADSTMVRQLPDSGYLFDVIASNSGGVDTFKNLRLIPYREQPYSPYNDYDPITGKPMLAYPNPGDSSVSYRVYDHPTGTNNVVGDSTELPIVNDSIRVLFHKTGDGNSLTFKFLNKDSVLIDPASFNKTNWDSLMHGFNVQVTHQYVKYDVVYPIPLVQMPTRYTNSSGTEASVEFAYDRKGFGGAIQHATIDFSFAIYQKGDWEILFYFHSDNPRFRNE